MFLKRRALMTRAQFNYKIANGSGSLILKNCKKSLFKRFEIHGKSAQVITKGLQLLDIAKIPTPQAGVSYYNMQVEEGKYTLSTKYRRVVQKDLFLLAGEVNTGASSNVNGVDSTISRTVESINGYITIGYRKGEYEVNPFDFETMLNKGDTPLPYEPYTGGKPSPSPEYPQEIVSVGKKSTNLIDVDKLRNKNGYLQSEFLSSIKINPFYVEKDKKYLLIAKGKSISNEYSTIYFGGDDLKYTYTNTYVLSTRLGEYTFNENKYVKIILTANKTAMITSVMIHGSKLSANEYEVEKLGLFEMSQSDSIDSIVYEPYSDKFFVDVEVNGKNLFNPKSTEYVQKTYRSYKVNKKKGISYITITLIDKENNADISGVSLGFSGDDTSATTDLTWLVSSTSIIKTKTTTAKYITIYPPRDEILEKILNRFDIQVEYGEEATEYEPYHEPQTIQLELNEPLRGIGQYKDIVTKKGVLRNCRKIEVSSIQWNHWNYIGSYRIIANLGGNITIPNATKTCNYTKNVESHNFDSLVYLYFTKEQIESIGLNANMTLEEANHKFNEIISKKPIEILYPLKTPIFEPFPPEIQTKLSSLYTNEGITVVTIDGGEVQPDIEVEYAADPE